MKRGTPGHPKTRNLARALGVEVWGAVGILESLWHFANAYAKRGDIGRHDDALIAEAVGWQAQPPGVLVAALVACGWLDRCRCHRLRVHDWPDHADQTLKRNEELRKSSFLECYGDASALLAESQHDASLPLPCRAVAVPSRAVPTPGQAAAVAVPDAERSALAARGPVPFNPPREARSTTQQHQQPTGPAKNPLVGDRQQLERDALRLVEAIKALTGEDGVEIMALASEVPGRDGGAAINPATMSDSRLALTVRDLRTRLRDERERRGMRGQG